jgi:adenylate kinase
MCGPEFRWMALVVLWFALLGFVDCFRSSGLVQSTRLAPLHLLVAGPPCSGKGTQCEFLKKKYNLIHISSGDLLRSSQHSNYHQLMRDGKLIPDEMVAEVVVKRLQEEDCQVQGWVLDGFPRTLNQAQCLSQCGVSIDAVLLFNVSDELVLERGLNRCIDPVTGTIYHRKLNPPPLSIAHRVIERSDDTKATLLRRLDEYNSQVKSISQYYRDRLHLIDSSRTAAEVNFDIENIVSKYSRCGSGSSESS